jgi:hypothetical protein
MADWTTTPFVNDDWTVNWGDVGTAAASFSLITFFEGIAAVVTQTFALVIRPIQATAETGVQAVEALFDPTILFDFVSGSGFARDFDGLGFVVAIGVIGVGAFLVAQAVDRLRP